VAKLLGHNGEVHVSSWTAEEL